MRKIFVLLLLAPLGVLAQNTGGNFTLSGTISNYSPADLTDYINISYIDGNKRVRDSAKIINNTFTIKGNLHENTLATLKFTKNKVTKSVFLTPANIKIKIAGENIKVTNSLAHNEYEKFRKNNGSIFNPIDSAIEAYGILTSKPSFKEKFNKKLAGDTSIRSDNDIKNYESITNQIYKGMEESKFLYITYLQQNPNTLIISYLIATYSQWESDKDKLKEFYSFIGDDSKELASVKNYYNEYVNVKDYNPIGSTAIQFTQNDESGNPIALGSFKGQYVLIDFWASWCVPCRGENPNLVAAYAKYKDKNFTILGISLDNNKEKWLGAIKKDGLSWANVSDLKGWGNEAGKLYNIKGIPNNFLLDPNGIIIAKNLRGAALEKKLAEILK